MRLIDADALIDDIKNHLWDWESVNGITATTVLKQTITDIGNQRTVFQPEIVRCRDCKHYTCQPGEWLCDLYEWAHEDDWFCADGERKEVK